MRIFASGPLLFTFGGRIEPKGSSFLSFSAAAMRVALPRPVFLM
jgi:hypothetical protein